MPGVVMTLVINVELLLMVLQVYRTMMMAKIFQIQWWGSV